MLFPVLLLCDEQGRYIDFTENDIVQALENVNDDDVRYFKPTDEELASYRNIYDTLVQEMLSKYQASSKPVMDYNKRKVENWADIQREQLNIQIAEMNAEIDELSAEATAVKDFLEKVDIRKKLMKRKNNFRRFKHHSIRKSLPSKKRPKEKLLSLTSNLTYSRFCLLMSC